MTTKLELNWIGKTDGFALIRDEEGKPQQVPYDDVQPRLLVKADEYGESAQDNILIQGENLFALKTLVKSGFADKFKCIYIDPPFNTDQAFEHYDDSLEHSLWLDMMRDRIELLYDLLSSSGTLFIHIDDNELAYLIAITDEIFDRKNRISIITFKQGSATGHKAINPGVVNTSNFIVIYAKNKSEWKFNRLFTGRERDKRYGQFIINADELYTKWRFTTLSKAFAGSLGLKEKEAKKIDDYEEKLNNFVLENAESVIQLARPDYDSVSSEARKVIDQSKLNPAEIMLLKREKHSDMYFIGGQRILFYSNKLKFIDGQYIAGEPLTSIWDDLLSNNLHKEGGVDFPKGKKPEALLKRILELSTKEGDYILDCFAGSGTTGAVALKMNRRFVMTQLGSLCETHIIPRLQNVINGTDKSGISVFVPPHPSKLDASKNLFGEQKKNLGWTGGGGFTYYSLGKSLMERDAETGVWRLNYTNGRMIEAVCLQEGFKLVANGWRHGIRGRHFAHISDQLITQEILEAFAAELTPEETLTVYYLKSIKGLNPPENVELKRLPRDLTPKTAAKKINETENVITAEESAQ
jgi:adenine-specific DNA-methyltransferase